MKNLKFLFLFALVCGFALNSNAQSVSYEYAENMFFYTLCDGVLDIIYGPVYGTRVDHYNPKTGELEWFKYSVRSEELVSQFTGEIFSVNKFHKEDLDPDNPVKSFHFNLRGSEGSHIILNRILNYDASTNTWYKIKDHAKCV